MKKIFSLFLFATSLLVINSLSAKTGKEKLVGKTGSLIEKASKEPVNTKEPGVAKEPVNTKEPGNIKVGESVKTNTIGADSSNNNTTAAFYKSHIKRFINLQDIYVGVGGGFIKSSETFNMPFSKGISLNGSYGVAMIDKYLILEFNNNLEFMFNPNMDWYSRAFTLPKSLIKGVNMGFDEEFDMGVHVVIAGSRKVTFTAGPVAGGRLTILPSMVYSHRLYYVSVPISVSYGLKTNLFVGDKFYCFAQYSNTLTTSMVSFASQASTDAPANEHRIPVNFGLLRLGVGYVLKPWW